MNNNKKDIIIIEYEQPDGIGGTYFINQQVIFVNSIKNKSILLHELMHHFWNMREESLKKILNMLELDFNTKPKKAMSNKFINECLNVGLIKKFYKPREWLEEAVAYILQEASEDSLRALDIPLLNRILEDDFYYYDGTNGNFIYRKTGEVVANEEEEINRIINFFMED